MTAYKVTHGHMFQVYSVKGYNEKAGFAPAAGMQRFCFVSSLFLMGGISHLEPD